ncbi:hypothetical protein TREES_T100010167 [Tupaia chinensis]|uniref:Uncharacterized protein n=1 Tax=Tupaia chinensis TaxID=246437 RepID=L9JCJ3_TUPCH|nr:hypothetical protein TREES_T100010167 [Tupaia chinensis]
MWVKISRYREWLSIVSQLVTIVGKWGDGPLQASAGDKGSALSLSPRGVDRVPSEDQVNSVIIRISLAPQNVKIKTDQGDFHKTESAEQFEPINIKAVSKQRTIHLIPHLSTGLWRVFLPGPHPGGQLALPPGAVEKLHLTSLQAGARTRMGPLPDLGVRHLSCPPSACYPNGLLCCLGWASALCN